jgi:hypothetical protein
VDDASALMPEMPSQCFTCGNWFELNDMYGCHEQCDNEIRCRACDRLHTDTHCDDDTEGDKP